MTVVPAIHSGLVLGLMPVFKHLNDFLEGLSFKAHHFPECRCAGVVSLDM